MSDNFMPGYFVGFVLGAIIWSDWDPNLDEDLFLSQATKISNNQELVDDLSQAMVDITDNTEDISSVLYAITKMQELGYKFDVNKELTNEGKMFSIDKDNKTVWVSDYDDDICELAINAVVGLDLK